MAAPDVVAAAAAMAACSCCYTAPTAAVSEVATAAWMVAMVVAKSDGAIPEAVEAMATVLKSKGGGAAGLDHGRSAAAGPGPGVGWTGSACTRAAGPSEWISWPACTGAGGLDDAGAGGLDDVLKHWIEGRSKSMRGRRREVREVESSRRVEAWSAVADRVGAATNQHRPKADRREGGGVWIAGSTTDRRGMVAS
jgi:hypothetical protein